MPNIHVHLLPALLDNSEFVGGTAVVIDVLRATTTIIHALAHGATAVLPCLTVEEAREQVQVFPPSERLLGGERGGTRIEGFDLGNSPLSYTRRVVSGKVIVFTTTNGTKALLRCRTAEEVLIGAFVNLTAVCRKLHREGRDTHLLCAGTDGQLTAEDILFAGAVADQLTSQDREHWKIGNMQAQMTLDFYQARSRDPQTFRETFYASLGAQNLIELGMGEDIERALQRDLFDVVPVWDPESGCIQLDQPVSPRK